MGGGERAAEGQLYHREKQADPEELLPVARAEGVERDRCLCVVLLLDHAGANPDVDEADAEQGDVGGVLAKVP